MVGSVFFRGVLFGAALIVPFSLFGMENKKVVNYRARASKDNLTSVTEKMLKRDLSSTERHFQFIQNDVKKGDSVALYTLYTDDNKALPIKYYLKPDSFKNNVFENSEVKITLLKSEDAQKAKLLKTLIQPIPTAQSFSYRHTGNDCSQCLSSIKIPVVETSNGELSQSGDVTTSGGSNISSGEEEAIVPTTVEEVVVVDNKKEGTQEKKVESNNPEQNSDKKPEIKANTSWLRFFTMRRMLMIGVGATVLVYLNWNYLKTLINR
jgi:hypothetical protein